MALVAKSKEELAVAKLRLNIIKQMEDCVGQNEAQKVNSYAAALSFLPTYLDYEIKE